MTTATVRYIANGYTVNWQGSQSVGVPASLYASSIPEAVYWLGRIFDPVSQSPPLPRGGAAPQIVENNDPLLGVEAVVLDIASGGFLVRQQSPTMTPRPVETYCPNVDAVSDLLTQIFTPPVEV
jgi:hypothetical protein